MIDSTAGSVPPEAVPPAAGYAPFYVVSKRKFNVLFLATLGLYSFYWFYENWLRYKAASPPESEARKIWPAPRALFPVFFFHSLFRKVKQHATGALDDWENGAHATFLVVAIIVTSVLDRMADKSVGSPATDVLSLLMLAALWFLYYKAQVLINISCGDPEGEQNNKFTVANYAWIGFGILIWIFAFIGGMLSVH